MDWKAIISSRSARSILSVALVVAILLALCWPGWRGEPLAPENPLEEEPVREITVLRFGGEKGEPDIPYQGEETTPTEPEEETVPTEPQTQPTVEPGKTDDNQAEPDDSNQDENQTGGADGENDGNSGTPGEGTELPDIALSFTWTGRDTGDRTKLCAPGASVSDSVKTVQLAGGSIAYRLALTGTDVGVGRILRASYTSQSGESGSLSTSGTLAMNLPQGMTGNEYTITVTALVKGQNLTFTVVLYFTYDVRLQMTYSLAGTEPGERTVTCESGRTLTVTSIYDDQLADGALDYKFTLIGSEGAGMTISSVSCYHSGSGRTENLTASGRTQLLLKEGKTGENTFTVVARDSAGVSHTFKINLPYKHRGENTIRIETNLQNGSTVINGTKNNLTVKAWSEDAAGNVLSYIPANGVDTRLIVQLDGQTLSYESVSGKASEYYLTPGNPETGDTNTHTLYIYAEDAYGNYGELTLTLKGQRNEAGQKIGTATVRVDLTVLGLGVVESLSYDVLADESVARVVEKAIGGRDLGAPYGSASQSLGWGIGSSGTLDIGYYLQRLSTGYTPNALEGSAWPGSTEEAVLQAIDDRFGKGTGLATLWRCIYRNGLNKSAGSGGSIGEFDYTSGSGWLFSVGGAYYPGQSMSTVYLQNGDVLTLRFTLAYGWDVGGGTSSYGNTVGYCVTAVNGGYAISHRMETVTGEDGAVTHVCRCCGLVEDCEHENMIWKDLEDGTHIQYCEDCRQSVGDPQEHTWDLTRQEEGQHYCSVCDAGEAHIWEEVPGTNTATCQNAGVRTMRCAICAMERQAEAPAKGHTYDNTWYYTQSIHYQKCSTCQEEVSKGSHSYVYDPGWEDYACVVCGVLHDWEAECGGTKNMVSATCQQITYSCGGCGCTLIHQGEFEEYHSYSAGVCQYCGKLDPGYVPEDPTETNRRRLQEEVK